MSQPDADRYDTILAGGTVLDPASGRNEEADVAIRAGTVAAIAAGLADAGVGDEVIDCHGRLVVPGLVEAHTHIFCHVSRVGAPPDEAHLRRGVVAAADAGTAGASTFEAFDRFIVAPSDMRILSFLNVSVLGLIDYRYGELLNPATLSPDDAIETAQAHPGTIRGFKIRLSEDVVGDRCLPLLDQAVAVADQAGLPLMVHIGDTADPLAPILERLRPGDIVSHCYTGKSHGILDGAAVLPEVHEARKRDLVFDAAHGRSNLDFDVARTAIGEGFLPDVISSDTSRRNWRGPVFDLVTSMSKFLALGVPIAEVVARATASPARLLGLDKEGYGALRVGGPAHVTVLDTVDSCQFYDAAGNSLEGPRLEPVTVLLAGQLIAPVGWRGGQPDEISSRN